MISLSSHILDTTLGCPAGNLSVTLTLPEGSKIQRLSNEDGRISDWGDVQFTAGTYHLRFDVAPYLTQHHGKSFYPYIDIPFTIDEERHYHVPLLLSPFGFSSYRGS